MQAIAACKIQQISHRDDEGARFLQEPTWIRACSQFDFLPVRGCEQCIATAVAIYLRSEFEILQLKSYCRQLTSIWKRAHSWQLTSFY
ncbi:MAG TPA: hypothetical protein VFX54_04370, partial [Candidatus Binatia bacterium]|nr:hypothetical protein [Candidatus Binatia bacterium]